MKVLVNRTMVMSISDIKKEIEKVKKLESDLSLIRTFDYLETRETHEKLQKHREKLENIVDGIANINIEKGEYHLDLNKGYLTYNVLENGKKDIHDYGDYESKEELLEAINNIYKVNRY